MPLTLAYPVSNITIDGEIKDWDTAIPNNTISKVLEGTIENPQDLEAVFKIGFSAKDNAVYVAIIVEDDHHIIDTLEGEFAENQDQCLLYLDKKHSPKGSGVNVYSFNELYKDIDDASTSWDDAVQKADWKDLEVASKRKDNKTLYEE